MQTVIDLLDMQQLATGLVEFLPDLIAGFFILLLFWILYRVARGPLEALLLRVGFHATLVRMLVHNVFRFSLLLIGLIMAADQVGINVGAALAGIGVAGLAISFAAQDSLANIIAGFLVFIDKPFLVGDWVSVAGQYGEVNFITMRSTRIRTNNNTYVVIPNRTIIDEVLVNHSKHGETRVEIPVAIAYKEDIRRAREVLLGTVGRLPEVMKDPPPDVVVTELGSSSVDMLVRVWIERAGEEKPCFYAILEASKLALDQAGIEIPYHHLQLFVENVDDRVLEKAARLVPSR